MCDKHDAVRVEVKTPDGFATAMIDECLVDLVTALQGLPSESRTVESCCGHGELAGVINLADGRALLVTDWDTALNHRQSLAEWADTWGEATK